MFPDFDEVIHQPKRLQIITLLHRNREASFGWLRESLHLTDGNLGRHLGRLREAGYADQRRVLTNKGFQLRIWITPRGDEAFRAYLGQLRGFMESQAAAGPRD